MKYKKIIIFDVDSSNDIVQMENYGKIHTEIVQEFGGDLLANTKAEAEIKSKGLTSNLLKKILGAELSANINVEGTAEFSKFSNKIITNTIMTDFLKITSRKKDYVKLDNYMLDVIPDSYAFYKLLCPMIDLIDTEDPGFQLPNGLDIKKIGHFVSQSKGYYEFFAKSSEVDKKIILRINSDSFKNNYTLQDIVGVNISWICVKVGRIHPQKIGVTNFINEINPVDATQLSINDNTNQDYSDYYEMYDVLLGGIK